MTRADVLVMPTDASMTRRLTAAYRAASDDALSAGHGWYPAARAAALALCPTDLARGAGVIAALSPRAQWSVNLSWAGRVIGAADIGGAMPAVSTMNVRHKAWRIATGEDPLGVLRGPKVRAFYRGIVGDPGAVVIDTWAARAAVGSRLLDDRLTELRYASVAAAYRRAGRILSVPPRDLQAVIWVHTRGRAG